MKLGRVPRKIFVSKSVKVKWAWRKLRNGAIKFKRIGGATYVECIRAVRNSRLVLAKNPEVKKQLRRPIRR